MVTKCSTRLQLINLIFLVSFARFAIPSRSVSESLIEKENVGRSADDRKINIVGILSSSVSGIPVDNDVEGEVEIECASDTVRIKANTRNAFEGHVYVKGRYDEEECHNEERGNKWGGIVLPFSTCGLRRERSLNPRGVFIYTTVIFSFHPLFVTKVDKAYRIQCFYMEADKTVDTGVEVSMLTTNFYDDLMAMPVCRYEVLDGGPSGPIINYASIGQKVYHKWTCDSETVDSFCMIVYGCFVDDTSGNNKIELIDDDGCGVDRNLLTNLDYLSDLMAGQETHVFKYADRPQLYFNCQIQITIKEPFADCPRPVCDEPGETLGRRKRSITSRTDSADLRVMDVSSQDIQILELVGLKDSETSVVEGVRFHGQSTNINTDSRSSSIDPITDGQNSLCMGLPIFLLLLITITLMAIFFLIFVFTRRLTSTNNGQSQS